MRDARMNPRNRNSLPPSKAAGGDAAHVNLARIKRVRDSLGGGDAALAELIDLFLADLPRRLATITAAVESGDAAALALHAHALRGGAANFGAARLDDLCGRLEAMGRRGALDEAYTVLAQLLPATEPVRRALLAIKSGADGSGGAPTLKLSEAR